MVGKKNILMQYKNNPMVEGGKKKRYKNEKGGNQAKLYADCGRDVLSSSRLTNNS